MKPKQSSRRIGRLWVTCLAIAVMGATILCGGIAILLDGNQPCGIVDSLLLRPSGCLQTFQATGFAFSPDSRLLALTQREADTVMLWDTTNQRALHTFHISGPGKTVFSSNSQILAVALPGEGKVMLLDTTGARDLGTLGPGQEQHSTSASDADVCVGFSPDGRLIAVGDAASYEVYDIASGERLTRRGSEALAPELMFLHDNKTVVSRGFGEAFSWDAENGMKLHTFGPYGDGPQMTLAPDGAILALAGHGALDLWDPASGKKLRTLVNNNSFSPSQLRFSPDGKIISAIDVTKVHMWGTDTGQELSALPGGRPDTIALSPDGSLLVSGETYEYRVRFWDAVRLTELRSLKWPSSLLSFDAMNSIEDVLFSPDGKLLAVEVGYRQVALLAPPGEAKALPGATSVSVQTQGPMPTYGPTQTMRAVGAANATVQVAQASLAAALTWPIVISDSFDSNANMWPVPEVGVATAVINAGKYRWRLSPANKYYIRQSPGRMTAQADMYVSADLQRVEAPRESEYGLLLRAPGKKGETYYLFMIREQGYGSEDKDQFRVWRDSPEGLETPWNWTNKTAIRPGEANHLALIRSGPHLIFFINDQYVAQVEDNSLNKVKAGIAMQGINGYSAVFEFDNFEVRAP